MNKTKEELVNQYQKVVELIKKNSQDRKIKICCVTKYSSPEEINWIIQAGANIIGENKIQDAEKKFPFLKPVEKHFIGHLQSNKIKKAINLFDAIQTIDSLELARKINNLSKKIFPIMIQVNIGREPQKHGILEEELEKIIEEIKKLPRIKILGLMTILPNTKNESEIKRYFNKMHQLNKKNNFQELSMGMSQDYLFAIQEGSTIVRIGSAIFK